MTEAEAVEQVLADWREVQRHIEEAPDGSAESARLQEESGRLRREYQSLVSHAMARFLARPVPATLAELDPG